MIYTEEILDRSTGELITVSKGDWITITELAGLYEIGPRKARSVLRHMNFLGLMGGRDHVRHRIEPWAVEAGFGRRNKPKAGAGIPFDVISPEGRDWIEARWSRALADVEAEAQGSHREAARLALIEFQEGRLHQRPLAVHEAVSWFLHHFPDLTHTDMASNLDVSQQLVSRYVAERIAERQRQEARKNAEVPNLGKIKMRGLNFDQDDEPDVYRR